MDTGVRHPTYPDIISKAVDETRGQILPYNGKFVYSEFHAYTMAQEGKKAKEIVEHYYPGTMWTQLYK